MYKIGKLSWMICDNLFNHNIDMIRHPELKRNPTKEGSFLLNIFFKGYKGTSKYLSIELEPSLTLKRLSEIKKTTISEILYDINKIKLYDSKGNYA